MSIDQKLKRRISLMVKTDQDFRQNKFIKKLGALNKKFTDKGNPVYKKEVAKLSKELTKLDQRNTDIMKKIITRFGWPVQSLVGKKGAHGAWLLIQHSPDHDFQGVCLDLLKKAVKLGEADAKDLAFLTDRVLIHQGKRQIYGTQFKGKGYGDWELFPVRDIKKLDIRRKKVGLESSAKNFRKIKARYK